MNGNPQLVAYLQQRILERGRIPFSEYMDAVLYHPEYGYYQQDTLRIGAAGDFYTAADLDPAMGILLAKLFGRMSVGIDQFCLVEIGAGNGQLARHILEAQVFPYSIVERSPALRRRQRENLQGFSVQWCDELPSEISGCVFSNEFYDALPVRRFVRRNGKVKELFVAEGFAEVEGAPETEIDLPLLGEGCRADVAFEAIDWVRRIAGSIRSGYHLAIDYGYLREELFAHSQGTLMCYRKHGATEDPYSAIGEQDITAHVNFSDLIDCGESVGLETVGYRNQMGFLLDLGVMDLMEPLAARQDVPSIRRLQAMKSLILPPMMGERFKVLLQRKALESSDLPGFGKAGGF